MAMDHSYDILTDTSCNLATPYLKENGIRVVPFTYFVNGRDCQCEDTENFDAHAYYQSMRDGRVEIHTTQINPSAYEEAIRPSLEEGKDVLFISMSSGISGAFQSLLIAMEELKEAYPKRSIKAVDTLGASLGEGLLVMRAVAYREQGMALPEAAWRLEQDKKHVYQIFTVDDLMYLNKTGRLSKKGAVIGSALKIKPLLKGDEEGKIVMAGIARGRRLALKKLAERYRELVVDPSHQTIGIAHADAPEDVVELITMIKAEQTPAHIITAEYEPMTGSHVGPGTIALFFFGGPDVRSK